MSDTISRQAAIDALMGQPPEPHYPSWYAAQIEKLPAAQPERKQGKWIECNPQNSDMAAEDMPDNEEIPFY